MTTQDPLPSMDVTAFTQASIPPSIGDVTPAQDPILISMMIKKYNIPDKLACDIIFLQEFRVTDEQGEKSTFVFNSVVMRIICDSEKSDVLYDDRIRLCHLLVSQTASASFDQIVLWNLPTWNAADSAENGVDSVTPLAPLDSTGCGVFDDLVEFVPVSGEHIVIDKMTNEDGFNLLAMVTACLGYKTFSGEFDYIEASELFVDAIKQVLACAILLKSVIADINMYLAKARFIMRHLKKARTDDDDDNKRPIQFEVSNGVFILGDTPEQLLSQLALTFRENLEILFVVIQYICCAIQVPMAEKLEIASVACCGTFLLHSLQDIDVQVEREGGPISLRFISEISALSIFGSSPSWIQLRNVRIGVPIE